MAGIDQQVPLMDRVARVVAHPYFAAVHRLRWVGAQRVPRRGPAILAANHQSFYDPVVIGLAVRRHVRFMAWDHYYNMPLLGGLMALLDAVPVDTEEPGPTALSALLQTLEGGQVVGIFPEGARTPDGLIQKPQPGVAVLAMRTGAPLVPVTIAGAHRAWPVGRALPRPAPIALHVGEPFRADDIRPQASRPERRVAITYELMLRVADGFRTLGRAALAERCRRRLLALRRANPSGATP